MYYKFSIYVFLVIKLCYGFPMKLSRHFERISYHILIFCSKKIGAENNDESVAL